MAWANLLPKGRSTQDRRQLEGRGAPLVPSQEACGRVAEVGEVMSNDNPQKRAEPVQLGYASHAPARVRFSLRRVAIGLLIAFALGVAYVLMWLAFERLAFLDRQGRL